MAADQHDEAGFPARIKAELQKYAVISGYLFICFSVILIYEDSQSLIKESTPIALGIALGKALVLGKFLLIGEALKSGSRLAASTLLTRIVLRTLGMLLVVIVLKVIEELVLHLVHGGTIGGAFDEFARESVLSLLGPVLLMMLILIPLITVIELNRVLGHTLRELLLAKQPTE